MKVALCIFGPLRNYKHTYNLLKKHVLDVINPDVFIHGYFNKEGEQANYQDIRTIFNIKGLFLQHYTEELIKQLSSDSNSSRFENHKRSESNIDRILSQYYNLIKCMEMKQKYEKENNFNYDIVIRARSDVFFHRNIIEEECELAKLGNVLIPYEWDFKCVHPLAVSDSFAMSNSENMDKYASIYPYLGKYFDEGCIFHPESLMGYHIKKMDLNRIEIKSHFWFEYPDDFPIENKNRKEY